VRSRLAWALAAFTAAGAVADTLITAAYSSLLSRDSVAVHGWPFVPLAVVGSAVMGALIVSRYPRHPVGWLLSGVGVTGVVSIVAETYSVWVVEEGGPGPRAVAELAGWLSWLLGPVALTGFTLMFLVAPDGRLLSRQWRYVGAASVAGLGCYAAGVLVTPPNQVVIDTDPTAGSPLAGALFTVSLVLIAVTLIAAFASLVPRLRRAHGEARQQLQWIAASAAFLATGLVCLLVVPAIVGETDGWLARIPLFLAYLVLPVFMAVAVLRYRLYNIEPIINRAVLFATGALFAAGGYVVLVVVLGDAVASWTGGFWPSLLATAVVALAFQPLRRRVVRLADRIAYGRRAAPHEALSSFSQRLGATPSPQVMLPAVAEAAGRAVSARRATATLRVPGAAALVATWPDAGANGGPDHEVIVRERTQDLGAIAVEMPPGRALRQREQELLHALADQAALAFRNTALDAELAGHVAALDQRTQALAASRRRIIDARDSERRRLEAAISRDVLPHLLILPDALEQARTRGADSSVPDALEDLAADVTTALERLREISHGIFPTQLARTGLPAALASYLGRAGLRGRLHVDASAAGRRFGARAEAAAYFCCTACVNVSGPAAATSDDRLDLTVEGTDLVLRVHGATPPDLDLQAVTDRVEALGGRLSLRHDPQGAVVELRVPVADPD
jgi:signal transduction histidine kinase